MIAYGSVLTLLFWLLVGHAIADFTLQPDTLASAKRRTAIGELPWQVALSAHSAIHAGFVALVTGSVFLGTMELLAHSAIDFAKCEGRLREVVERAKAIVSAKRGPITYINRDDYHALEAALSSLPPNSADTGEQSA